MALPSRVTSVVACRGEVVAARVGSGTGESLGEGCPRVRAAVLGGDHPLAQVRRQGAQRDAPRRSDREETTASVQVKGPSSCSSGSHRLWRRAGALSSQVIQPELYPVGQLGHLGGGFLP